jgi:hypothetical protein
MAEKDNEEVLVGGGWPTAATSLKTTIIDALSCKAVVFELGALDLRHIVYWYIGSQGSQGRVKRDMDGETKGRKGASEGGQRCKGATSGKDTSFDCVLAILGHIASTEIWRSMKNYLQL